MTQNQVKSSQVKSTWLDLKFKSGISDLTWLDLKIEKEGKDLILTWTWGDMGCTTQNQLGGGDIVYKGVAECIYMERIPLPVVTILVLGIDLTWLEVVF